MTRPAATVALACIASLMGCVPVMRPGEPATPAVADTLWYVSSRAQSGGRDLKISDTLEFGFVVATTRIGSDTLAGSLRLTLVDSVRLSRFEFVEALRVRAFASRDDGTVFSVHGFGTSLHEAWSQAAAARIRSRTRGPWVVYCWPSRGSGFTWPRRGQLLTRAYREDSAAAAASRGGFALALGAVLDAVGATRTLVLAHSLGAQIVGETLALDTALRGRLSGAPLRALAFIAADVERTRFTDHYVPALIPMARRLALYASRNDRVLAISRTVNKTERAGLADDRAGGALVAPGLEFVDITDGIAAEGGVRRRIGSHHTMGRESGAYFDLVYVVGAGLSQDCRAVLGTGTQIADGVWRLTAVRGKIPPAAGACAPRLPPP